MASENMTSAGIGKSPRVIVARPLVMSLMFCALLLAGCGGGTTASTAPSVNDTVHAYQGVTNLLPSNFASSQEILYWSFVVGQTETSFSYTNDELTGATGQGAVNEPYVTGSYAADGGYLALTSQSTNPAGQFAGAGYALAIPGQAALLRPGNGTVAPMIAAAMDSCTVLKGGTQFLFVALPGVYWNPATSAAYGSVQASTDATGETWSFSNHSQSLFAGSGSPPSYPASFTGTCGQGISGYSIGVLPTVATPNFDPLIAVSPAGFFTETATGQESNPAINGRTGAIDYAQQPFVGFIAPTSPLDTTGLAAAKYLGLMYESLPASNTNQNMTTQIVSFGSVVAGSGTTMTGGVFPNDDPSQTPPANMTVNFGTQSASQNGLYTGVTVTLPDATEIHVGVNNCTNNGGTSGIGASGGLTCSFNAVAIAGNPQNNFAVFLIGWDPLRQAPFGFYLYQQ